MPGWLLALIVVPRLVVLALAFRHPAYLLQPDSFGYLTLAQNLRTNFAFTFDPILLTPDFYRVPGYPLFLLPFTFFSSPAFWIAAVQTGIVLATLWGVWSWLCRITSLPGAAIGTAVIAADLVVLLHTPIVLSDTLFLCGLTWAVSQTWWVLNHPEDPPPLKTAVFWGALALIRPVGIFLGPAVSLFWFQRKKTWATFLIVAALLPGLWIVRNGFQAGFWGLSSQGGIDFFNDTAASIEALAQKIPMEEARSRLKKSARTDSSPAHSRISLETLRRHPWVFLRCELQGALKILGGTGLDMLPPLFNRSMRQDSRGLSPTLSGSGTAQLHRQFPYLIVLQILYWLALGAVYIAFWMGVCRFWKAGRRREALFLAGGCFYFILLSSHVGTYRLRIPIMPFLAAGVAAAVGGVRSTWN